MYAKIQNGNIIAYPYTLLQLQQDNPSTSFTENLSIEDLILFNVVVVYQVNPPKIDYTHSIQEIAPSFDNGIWHQNWAITEASEQEISNRLELKSSDIRTQRNFLLSQSDWTQVLDAPVDREAWSTYRQALRDITNQPGFPLEVIWPQQPSN